MLELQVRRGGSWRRVDASVDRELLVTEANAVYRGSRRRNAVRVVAADGTQALYLRATTGR